MNENQTENLSFEDEILKKYDNGISMSDDDMSEAIFMYEIDREDLDEYRWTTLIRSVIKVKDRYFEIDWIQGNTEMQEDDFSDSSLKEVFPVKKTATFYE